MRLTFNDGALELLKWIALCSMLGDHINKYLFHGSYPLLYDFGSLAMPLFCFVLAYNLARDQTLVTGVYPRVLGRLFIFGVIATPAYMYLGDLLFGWWPWNVLFMLLLMTFIIYLIEQRKKGYYLVAVILFLLGSSMVEYGWLAIAFGVSCWLFIRFNSYISLIIAIATLASLYILNNNFYALLVIPLIASFWFLKIHIPRLKWFFYILYPLHLYLLLFIKISMEKG